MFLVLPVRVLAANVPALLGLHRQVPQLHLQDDGGMARPVVTSMDDSGVFYQGEESRRYNKVIQSRC